MATRSHVDPQAAQAGLAVVIERELARVWPTLEVDDLRVSLPRFKALVAALVRKYGQASTTLAVQAYQRQREAAGITAPFRPQPAPLPTVEQVAQTVDWATQPLWSAEPDVTLAQTQLQGATEALVLDVGRTTVIDNARRDRHAKGWARIPEPGACYFCALLAIRGAVYKDGSFDDANARFLPNKDTPSTVKTHDHCRCHAEPVFNAYEPSAQIREWQALYDDEVQGRGDLLKTWRQVFEERNVTRTDRRSNQPKVPGSGGRSRDEIQAELTALENNLPNVTTDAARKYHEERIAKLRRLLAS